MLLLEGEEVGRDAGGKLREARKRQGPVVVELMPGIPGPDEPDLRAQGMGKDLPQRGDLLLRGPEVRRQGAYRPRINCVHRLRTFAVMRLHAT